MSAFELKIYRMSDPSPSVDLCFICKETLSEGEVRLVKERGVKTLLASSISLKNIENQRLLKCVNEIYVHSACQIKYNNPKLIKAAVSSGKSNITPLRATRSVSEQFNFREHCCLCGDKITEEFLVAERKKKPEKRNNVITAEKLSLSASILKAAEKRGDEWALKIKERISENTDLVALDARYHRFCQTKLYQAPPTGKPRGNRQHPTVDEAMEKIYSFLEENAEECQFSLDELMDQIEGERPQLRTVKNRLFAKYGEDILIVERPFKHTIVCFKNTGHKILTSTWYDSRSSDPQAERQRVVKAAAEVIREDIRSQVYDTTQFTPSDDFFQNVNSVIPDSLKLLLETVILKDKRSCLDSYRKKCVALAHSIISAVRPRSFISCLLHGIGVFLYHKFGSKHLVELLSTLGFSASYKDTMILETSAIMRPDQLMLKDPSMSFVQFSFDNADFNVNTLDGTGTFHAMGGIMIVTPHNSSCPENKIDRLTKCTASELVQRNPPIQLETFQKVPSDQGLSAINIVNLDNIHPLPEEIVPLPSDILWLYGKVQKNLNIPGWNGFMEEATVEKHFETSKIICLPFINHLPSNYDTVLTSLRFANDKCRAHGQKTCVVTFDQPLYIKAKEIVANCQGTDLSNVVVRLGGFHLLMSFLGSIGMIMSGSGLKELLSTIYAENSIDKMLSGHSRAVRAHNLVSLSLANEIVKTIQLTEEEKSITEDIISNSDRSAILTTNENEQFQTLMTKFTDALCKLESNGPTAKLWVLYFRMVTLMKQFIQAERTGDWNLHLDTVQKMLPFFHAAGHFFYAKCAQLYLQDMLELERKMDPLEYDKFTKKGYFTIRRTNKFWSGIWSDMTIEQVLMKSMKSYGGLTRGRGMTDSVLSRWTLGMVYLHNICHEVDTYCEVTTATTEQHVDMRPSRITRDESDTEKLCSWFAQHPPFLTTDLIMSISSGLVGESTVNSHMALEIGRESMLKMVGQNFQEVKFKRKNNVVSLSSAVRTITVDNKQVTVDPLTLFHRLCVLKQSDEELREFFTYELSPIPMSLFSEEGMRKGTKSTLYSVFQPVTLNEEQGLTKFVVVDGGHLLHKVVWPRSSSFGAIADRYIQYITAHYGSNVAVVFDGYPVDAVQKNTKSSERLRRAKSHSSREIIVDEKTMAQVPQQKFLSNDKNKTRFIKLLTTKMGNHNIQVLQAEEDADRLIITTAVTAASTYDRVVVVGEDIDLLIILTAISNQRELFYNKCGRGKASDVMYSSIASSKSSLKPELFLFIHAFSGCDSTSCFFGLGKKQMMSIVEKNPDVEKQAAIFLDTNSTPDEIAAAGERVIIALYGGNPNTYNLDELRYQLFARAATKISFNLARLPPTRDSARFHSLRTYHQVKICPCIINTHYISFIIFYSYVQSFYRYRRGWESH